MGRFFVSAQPALHYPFISSPLCDRRLWPRRAIACQRWRAGAALGAWLAASVFGFVLWALPTSLMVDGREAPLIEQAAAALGFVLACASGCFDLLALLPSFCPERTRILDIFRSMPTACTCCTTFPSSGCNICCCPSHYSRRQGRDRVQRHIGVELGRRRAFATWHGTIISPMRSDGCVRASAPAPAKLVKQDDLTG